MKVEFVDSQRKEHGVQPDLRALEGTPAQIAPSTYCAAKTRPESARAASDWVLAEKIEQVHEDNYSVYGVRKVWAKLNHHGVDVAGAPSSGSCARAGCAGCRGTIPRARPARQRRPADRLTC
ncbi:IS3 family transposase [Amycolatopsis sp. CA-128772]|uniref:IS3 family transposase n=1 Tax=Amycolatopsis sp. CA-128772 TaxID=2073159 RepID=UPI000CD25B17|nr:IS3 family transposase [Amycolatopsis sp. CA-128772]